MIKKINQVQTIEKAHSLKQLPGVKTFRANSPLKASCPSSPPIWLSCANDTWAWRRVSMEISWWCDRKLSENISELMPAKENYDADRVKHWQIDKTRLKSSHSVKKHGNMNTTSTIPLTSKVSRAQSWSFWAGDEQILSIIWSKFASEAGCFCTRHAIPTRFLVSKETVIRREKGKRCFCSAWSWIENNPQYDKIPVDSF